MRQTFIYLVAICNIRERGKKHDIKTSIKDMESNVKNGTTNKTHTMEEINE